MCWVKNIHLSTSMIKATAVLITRLKEYPKEILDALPAFDEVLIKTECPSVLYRYELATQAKNDLIFFQDDDCLVDVEELYKHYNGQLTNFIKEGHYRFYNGSGITLIGWGCFFPKSMLDFSKYIEKYEIDDLLLSQADRVFTYLNQPHNTIIRPVVDLPTAADSTRMSTQWDHWTNLQQIRNHLSTINLKE